MEVLVLIQCVHQWYDRSHLHLSHVVVHVAEHLRIRLVVHQTVMVDGGDQLDDIRAVIILV